MATRQRSCYGPTVLLLLPTAFAMPPDRPIECTGCAEWNAPRAPFRVAADTWYVGPAGLSSLLVATEDGLVLLDGALPQSVPAILDAIRVLGFDPSDVERILVSHAHFDHVGGVAALVEATGAEVLASPWNARVLRKGRPEPDDPQAAYGRGMRFPGVAAVTEVADGEGIELGGVRFTARYTPGHTPGSTTWTWRACEGGTCADVVYADSLNAVAAPGFRFGDHPDVVAGLRRSADTVAALPCDVLLSVHPEQSGLFDRADAGSFVDPEACRAYAQRARERLDEKLAGGG